MNAGDRKPRKTGVALLRKSGPAAGRAERAAFQKSGYRRAAALGGDRDYAADRVGAV